ncbi:MAG: zinc-dependent alcohol dehydrogenase family protein [Pseudomonadota bacterium]
MKALVYEKFEGQPKVVSVDDPSPEPHGVVVKVLATGLCRSDWHGWKGDDPDIDLPHVPGHELVGRIEAIGSEVNTWSVGDRVTVPFVGGCGTCPQCASANQQVCDAQFQPGFTHWGSFAEYVGLHYADVNLVALPDEIDAVDAAILGCRFATAWRAVVDQGGVRPGMWVAVHGCGGVGLSAIMIAHAFGARVIAIDVKDDALTLAKQVGADHQIHGVTTPNVAEAVKSLTHGGAAISIDAVGDREVCYTSIRSLRKRGRHIQIGLLDAEESNPNIPLARVIADELEIFGSHGMQAWRYPEMIALMRDGRLNPGSLIKSRVSLAGAANALKNMGTNPSVGVTVIDKI